MNRTASACLLTLLSACAGGSHSRPASGLATQNERGEKVVCRMERPIGSNIAEMVCRTEESVAAQRQASQDAIRTVPKTAPQAAGQ